MAIEPGRMTVHFGDELEVDYESGEFGELSLAYALTVHKSQGSEYRAVILAALDAAPMLLTRGVLYTAQHSCCQQPHEQALHAAGRAPPLRF